MEPIEPSRRIICAFAVIANIRSKSINERGVDLRVCRAVASIEFAEQVLFHLAPIYLGIIKGVRFTLPDKLPVPHN